MKPLSYERRAREFRVELKKCLKHTAPAHDRSCITVSDAQGMPSGWRIEDHTQHECGLGKIWVAPEGAFIGTQEDVDAEVGVGFRVRGGVSRLKN